MYAVKPIIDSSLPLNGVLARTMYTIKPVPAPTDESAASEATTPASSATSPITIDTITEQISKVQKATGATAADAEARAATIAARQAKLWDTLTALHTKLFCMQKRLQFPQDATNSTPPVVPPTGEPFYVVQELHRHYFGVAPYPMQAAQLPELVINANPHAYIPYALRIIKSLWQDRIELRVTVFQHSSVVGALPEAAAQFNQVIAYTRPTSAHIATPLPVLNVTLIWKQCAQCELLVNGGAGGAGGRLPPPIGGEANIVRFLYNYGPPELLWPEYRVADLFEADRALDLAYELTQVARTVDERRPVWRQLSELLQRRQFVNGALLGAADVAVASAARQFAYVLKEDKLPENVVKMANRVYELAEHQPWRH